MKEVLKTQLTIGLLAYFATVWGLIFRTYENSIIAAGLLGAQFIVMLLLAYVIILLLQWVRIFDLKTNSMITLIVLIGLGLSIWTNTLKVF